MLIRRCHRMGRTGGGGSMADSDDDALIAAIKRRDPTALMALYDQHGRLAFALAYRVLGDAGAAEEAVQDAFLIVWRRALFYDARGSARAWVLTIVRNCAIDEFRRAGRRHEVFGLEAAEETPAVQDVWGEVVLRLDRDEIRAAVEALPDEQRWAIELAYFEGLTHQEIAARCGTPLGTVKGRLRLGLQKLHVSLVNGRAPDFGVTSDRAHTAGIS